MKKHIEQTLGSTLALCLVKQWIHLKINELNHTANMRYNQEYCDFRSMQTPSIGFQNVQKNLNNIYSHEVEQQKMQKKVEQRIKRNALKIYDSNDFLLNKDCRM